MEELLNSRLNSSRTRIENGYSDLFKYFLLLKDKSKFRLYKTASELHALVFVTLFMQNIHTCYNGNKIQTFFGANKYSIDEYLPMNEILDVIKWE